jgi:hypothetical protein
MQMRKSNHYKVGEKSKRRTKSTTPPMMIQIFDSRMVDTTIDGGKKEKGAGICAAAPHSIYGIRLVGLGYNLAIRILSRIPDPRMQ